jgi:molybdenum cofactor biosynthesis enzyme MoaA
MEIFGKKVHIKPYVCSAKGGNPCTNSTINFYICATGNCPAHCSFCPGYFSNKKIDLNKLKSVLVELHNKKVINRIGITGGEPLLDLDNLNNILQIINDVCDNQYHVSINTNGINLLHLKEIDYFFIINDVHISRHSENDIENNKIFGISLPTLKSIKEEIERTPGIFSFSCNLMNGYIDSVEKLRKYLDYAINVGVIHVGFVSLMNKTDFCSNLFIDYESITSKLEIKDGFLFETYSKDKDYCKCENYTYYNNSGKVSIYFRRFIKNDLGCIKSFIFNEDNNLITNFGKEAVII